MKPIWYLIKIFTEEAHADAFMEGTLYMNRLEYFKGLEGAGSDGRGDVNEAVMMWHQPGHLHMTLNISGIGEVQLGPKDWAAPMSLSLKRKNHIPIFCMYAIWTDELGELLGEKEQKKFIEDLKRKMRVEERCLQFGAYAVIVSAVPFMTQLEESLQRQCRLSLSSLVEYYDETTFDGVFAESKALFMKQSKFAYQNEFRVALISEPIDTGPIKVNIGSLRGCAVKVEASKINENFGNCEIQFLGPCG